MLLVSLVLVAIELLSEQYVPVFSEGATLLLLLDDVAFNVNAVLAFTLVASLLIGSDWQATDTVSYALVALTSRRQLLVIAVVIHGHSEAVVSHGKTSRR